MTSPNAPQSTTPRTRILGTGSYVPDTRLSNAEVAGPLGIDPAWIVEKTGVQERRIAAHDQQTSDLAAESGRRALAAANVLASEVDLVLVATVTPDWMCPATACLVQHKLGCTRAFAFDFSAACTGFLYGLSIAEQYLQTGAAKTVLLIGAEIMSRHVNWEARRHAVLWGDGAGAVVLRRDVTACEPVRGLQSVSVYADGAKSAAIVLPGAGSEVAPVTAATIAADAHTIRLDGPAAFALAVECFSRSVRTELAKHGLTVADVDLFVPHQANLRILEAVAEALALPMEKVMVTVDRYGNASAATVPCALDAAVQYGRLRPGMLVVMAAVGGGATWGAAVYRW